MNCRQYTGWQDREGRDVFVGDLFAAQGPDGSPAVLEVCTDGFGSFFLEPSEGIADCQPTEWVRNVRKL